MADKDRYVVVIEDDTQEVVWRTGPYFDHYAEKMARGRGRNLDHKKYTVEVVKSDTELEPI